MSNKNLCSKLICPSEHNTQQNNTLTSCLISGDSQCGYLNDKLTIASGSPLSKSVVTGGTGCALQLSLCYDGVLDINTSGSVDYLHVRTDSEASNPDPDLSTHGCQPSIGNINVTVGGSATSVLTVCDIFVHKTGNINESIDGNKTFSCNVTIDGDLIVNGSCVINNVECMTVEDPMIAVNSDGSTTAGDRYGILAKRGHDATSCPDYCLTDGDAAIFFCEDAGKRTWWASADPDDNGTFSEYCLLLKNPTTDNIVGTLNHNSLSNIDGGTSGEYYHLTSSDYNALTNANGTVDSADALHCHSASNLDWNSFILPVKCGGSGQDFGTAGTTNDKELLAFCASASGCCFILAGYKLNDSSTNNDTTALWSANQITTYVDSAISGATYEHDSLLNIDGGNGSDEYYHLTYSDYNTLTAADGTVGSADALHCHTANSGINWSGYVLPVNHGGTGNDFSSATSSNCGNFIGYYESGSSCCLCLTSYNQSSFLHTPTGSASNMTILQYVGSTLCYVPTDLCFHDNTPSWTGTTTNNSADHGYGYFKTTNNTNYSDIHAGDIVAIGTHIVTVKSINSTNCIIYTSENIDFSSETNSSVNVYQPRLKFNSSLKGPINLNNSYITMVNSIVFSDSGQFEGLIWPDSCAGIDVSDTVGSNPGNDLRLFAQCDHMLLLGFINNNPGSNPHYVWNLCLKKDCATFGLNVSKLSFGNSDCHTCFDIFHSTNCNTCMEIITSTGSTTHTDYIGLCSTNLYRIYGTTCYKILDESCSLADLDDVEDYSSVSDGQVLIYCSNEWKVCDAPWVSSSSLSDYLLVCGYTDGTASNSYMSGILCVKNDDGIFVSDGIDDNIYSQIQPYSFYLGCEPSSVTSSTPDITAEMTIDTTNCNPYIYVSYDNGTIIHEMEISVKDNLCYCLTRDESGTCCRSFGYMLPAGKYNFYSASWQHGDILTICKQTASNPYTILIDKVSRSDLADDAAFTNKFLMKAGYSATYPNNYMTGELRVQDSDIVLMDTGTATTNRLYICRTSSCYSDLTYCRLTFTYDDCVGVFDANTVSIRYNTNPSASGECSCLEMNVDTSSIYLCHKYVCTIGGNVNCHVFATTCAVRQCICYLAAGTNYCSNGYILPSARYPFYSTNYQNEDILTITKPDDCHICIDRISRDSLATDIASCSAFTGKFIRKDADDIVCGFKTCWNDGTQDSTHTHCHMELSPTGLVGYEYVYSASGPSYLCYEIIINTTKIFSCNYNSTSGVANCVELNNGNVYIRTHYDDGCYSTFFQMGNGYSITCYDGTRRVQNVEASSGGKNRYICIHNTSGDDECYLSNGFIVPSAIHNIDEKDEWVDGSVLRICQTTSHPSGICVYCIRSYAQSISDFANDSAFTGKFIRKDTNDFVNTYHTTWCCSTDSTFNRHIVMSAYRINMHHSNFEVFFGSKSEPAIFPHITCFHGFLAYCCCDSANHVVNYVQAGLGGTGAFYDCARVFSFTEGCQLPAVVVASLCCGFYGSTYQMYGTYTVMKTNYICNVVVCNACTDFCWNIFSKLRCSNLTSICCNIMQFVICRRSASDTYAYIRFLNDYIVYATNSYITCCNLCLTPYCMSSSDCCIYGNSYSKMKRTGAAFVCGYCCVGYNCCCQIGSHDTCICNFNLYRTHLAAISDFGAYNRSTNCVCGCICNSGLSRCHCFNYENILYMSKIHHTCGFSHNICVDNENSPPDFTACSIICMTSSYHMCMCNMSLTSRLGLFNSYSDIEVFGYDNYVRIGDTQEVATIIPDSYGVFVNNYIKYCCCYYNIGWNDCGDIECCVYAYFAIDVGTNSFQYSAQFLSTTFIIDVCRYKNEIDLGNTCTSCAYGLVVPLDLSHMFELNTSYSGLVVCYYTDGTCMAYKLTSVIDASKVTSTYADFGEYYIANENIDPGYFVSVNSIGKISEVCVASDDDYVIGVISDTAGMVLRKEYENCENSVLVGLKGLVCVYICGVINKGDKIVLWRCGIGKRFEECDNGKQILGVSLETNCDDRIRRIRAII